MSISTSILNKALQSARINRGIGYDTYLFSYQSNRYVLRIENTNIRSRLKLERHAFILYILKTKHYIQRVIQSGVINGRYYFVTDYIKAMSISQLNRITFLKLQKILKDFHKTQGRNAGLIIPGHLKGEQKDWLNYIELNLQAMKRITKISSIFKKKLDLTSRSFRNLKSQIIKRTNTSLLHGDINRENLLNNKNKIFILDWENAQIGDPLADYAILDNFFNNNTIILSYVQTSDVPIFCFYKSFFLLKEIYYKKKSGMPVRQDLIKLRLFNIG